MAYHERAFDPTTARTQILKAVEQTPNLQGASAKLGITYKTLRRYVVRYKLEAAILKIYADRKKAVEAESAAKKPKRKKKKS